MLTLQGHVSVSFSHIIRTKNVNQKLICVLLDFRKKNQQVPRCGNKRKIQRDQGHS